MVNALTQGDQRVSWPVVAKRSRMSAVRTVAAVSHRARSASVPRSGLASIAVILSGPLDQALPDAIHACRQTVRLHRSSREARGERSVGGQISMQAGAVEGEPIRRTGQQAKGRLRDVERRINRARCGERTGCHRVLHGEGTTSQPGVEAAIDDSMARDWLAPGRWLAHRRSPRRPC